MDNIYIDMREQGFTLSNYYKNKDLVKLEDILSDFEQAIDDMEALQEKFDDYKEYVKDNYKELSQAELIGFNEKDYYG